MLNYCDGLLKPDASVWIAQNTYETSSQDLDFKFLFSMENRLVKPNVVTCVAWSIIPSVVNKWLQLL